MAELEKEKEKNLGEYITLLQASKLCSYSEPYLRLRARQGKFKSIKFGKKWMTTTQWIEDYVKKTTEWNERIAAKKISMPVEGSVAPAIEAGAAKVEAEAVFALPSAPPAPDLSETEGSSKIAGKEMPGNQAFDLALIAGSGLVFASLIFFAVAADNNFFDSVPGAAQIGSGRASMENIAEQLGQSAGSQDFVCPNSIVTVRGGRETFSSSVIEADQDPLKKFARRAVVAINNFRFPWQSN